MNNQEERLFDQVLLVEGIDDFHVVDNLCKRVNHKVNFDISQKKSVTSLLQSIVAEVLTPRIRTIGILVDADMDISARWQSIKDRLKKEGYDVPKLKKEGIIIQHTHKPKIGIWIMPDNEATGILEDFVKHMIPENDPLLKQANQTLDALEKNKQHRYKSKDRAKALIHTWLAWQESPGTPMGQAITKRYLKETDSEVCKAFVKWLKTLFDA